MKSSRRAKHSRNLHASKLRVSFHPSPLAKKIILTVIIIVMIIVVGLVTYSFFFTKENQIKWQISKIAADYYEDYYYQNLLDSSQNTDEIYNYLENHHEKGLPNITLNLLLSYDSQKTVPYENFLNENCDRNTTLVKIYPDPPYSKKSYHIEYAYSCSYE